MPDLLLRLFSQFVNRVQICYLPVYYPSPAEQTDPSLYANHCQQMFANVLRIPTSDASFEDYVEAAKRHRKKTRIEGLIERPSPQTTPRPNKTTL